MTDPLSPPVPRWLRVWAWLTALAALPLAALGAEVTTKKVGMVDPKGFRAPWHLFTLDADQLYLGYLIEHGHRLAGFVVGICCIVLAVGMAIGARGWYRCLGFLALIAVASQGILGIFRVDLNALMGPNLALLHGCFAQLVFAVLVGVAVLASRTWSLPADTPMSLRVAGWILCGVLYSQIVFGAITRHLADPLAQRLHIVLAFVVFGMALWLFVRLRREGTNSAARHTSHVLTALVFFQPILGVEAWLRRFGTGTLPELVPSDPTLDLIRSGHHLLGTLIFVTTAALAVLLSRPTVAVHASVKTPVPVNPMPPMPFTPARQLEGSA